MNQIKAWSLSFFYKAKGERCIIKKAKYIKLVYTSQERQMNKYNVCE